MTVIAEAALKPENKCTGSFVDGTWNGFSAESERGSLGGLEGEPG